ncbi:MAG: hypothetical protein WCR04_12000 [Fibrobacteraceae bacterium]|jgi:hypothetical protein
MKKKIILGFAALTVFCGSLAFWLFSAGIALLIVGMIRQCVLQSASFGGWYINMIRDDWSLPVLAIGASLILVSAPIAIIGRKK